MRALGPLDLTLLPETEPARADLTRRLDGLFVTFGA
jgi:hypothetical protein